MKTIRFEVKGQPIPQGSKKAFVVRGRAVMKDDNPDLDRWRGEIAAAASVAAGHGWEPWDGPVMVTLTAFLVRPPGTRFLSYPAGPPDVDKLQRAVGDALTQSRVITDDARIVQWVAGKRWAPGQIPFIAVSIETYPRGSHHA